MRIHKALADHGVASRRGAEKLITEGRVTVNGHKATIGQDIDLDNDTIHIDGERIEFVRRQHKYYIMLYKPRGYVTTLSDELGRRCIKELVDQIPARIYPIGRLDKDSEGMLLLTNDGEFANFIMHPKHHISKTYRVTVRPDISEDQIVALSTGVTLDDGYQTAPAQVMVETKEPGRVVLRITIFEGKNRQIRRMCEGLGLEVARLRRVSVGPLKLGMLQPGEWRELTPVEVGAVRGAVTIENARSAEPRKKVYPKATRNAPTGKPFQKKRSDFNR